MIENPVNNPIVPPMADTMSIMLVALSFVILSNIGVLKDIRMIFRSSFQVKSNPETKRDKKRIDYIKS